MMVLNADLCSNDTSYIAILVVTNSVLFSRSIVWQRLLLVERVARADSMYYCIL
jgi:transcriptional regulator of nitric oxide reductase